LSARAIHYNKGPGYKVRLVLAIVIAKCEEAHQQTKIPPDVPLEGQKSNFIKTLRSKLKNEKCKSKFSFLVS